MPRPRPLAALCTLALLALLISPASGEAKDAKTTAQPPAPATAQQWRDRGTAHLQAGQAAFFAKGELKAQQAALRKLTTEAIADFTHAIEAEPADALTYLNRACALMENQEFKDALRDAGRAAELNPKLADAQLVSAWLKLDLGDVNGCIAAASRCLELEPENRDAWSRRGVAHQEKGEFEEAIHAYSRNLDILTVRPPELTSETVLKFTEPVTLVRPYFRIDVHLARGACYYARKQWRQAFFDFEYVAHWPETRRATLPYVFVLRPRLDSDFARKTEDTAEQLRAALAQRPTPQDPPWLGTLNDFLLGKIDEPALVKAMGGPAAEPGAVCLMWYFCGMQRLQAGQKGEAKECFRKSVAVKFLHSLPNDLAVAELKMLTEQ